MSLVLVCTLMSLFLKLGGYANWKMKRKNVGCIWEYQPKTKQENGFSLPEQRERLESFCKFRGYEIIDYYEDAGISAKTGNHRPEFERLKDDIKAKKINTIVALKLDRITRSIYDWENLMTFLDENGNKVEFEAVARIFLGEQEYLLLAPVEEKDSEDIYVFRIDEVDGKQELNLVEDDKEFIAVKKEYNKLLY